MIRKKKKKYVTVCSSHVHTLCVKRSNDEEALLGGPRVLCGFLDNNTSYQAASKALTAGRIQYKCITHSLETLFS